MLTTVRNPNSRLISILEGASAYLLWHLIIDDSHHFHNPHCHLVQTALIRRVTQNVGRKMK